MQVQTAPLKPLLHAQEMRRRGSLSRMLKKSFGES
jgi:hypothetical protein